MESPTCDNRTLLLVVRDKRGDNINVTKRVNKGGNEYEADKSIAALHEDALFYQGYLNDDDGLYKENVMSNFGDGTLEMVEKELLDQIRGAKANRLSNERSKTLNTIIDSYKPIFKI